MNAWERRKRPDAAPVLRPVDLRRRAWVPERALGRADLRKRQAAVLHKRLAAAWLPAFPEAALQAAHEAAAWG